MLIGLIATPREDTVRSPERLRELAAKYSEGIKQLPDSITVKGRYLFGVGDNFKAIAIFDAQGPEQLLPLQMAVMEYVHCDFCPVIDNTEEVVQQAVR